MVRSEIPSEWKELYALNRTAKLVDVPAMDFIMVDGKGDPNGPEFAEAVNALYGLAYTIKFDMKKAGLETYKVMPLEGLWWSTGEKFVMGPRDEWLWTAMIAQPSNVGRERFDDARDKVRKKKPGPKIEQCRFERFREGECVQMLHLGPYATEPTTVAKMTEFMSANGLRPNGKHHEIYMSDPRKGKPESIKTLLRIPVANG